MVLPWSGFCVGPGLGVVESKTSSTWCSGQRLGRCRRPQNGFPTTSYFPIKAVVAQIRSYFYFTTFAKGPKKHATFATFYSWIFKFCINSCQINFVRLQRDLHYFRNTSFSSKKILCNCGSSTASGRVPIAMEHRRSQCG